MLLLIALQEYRYDHQTRERCYIETAVQTEIVSVAAYENIVSHLNKGKYHVSVITTATTDESVFRKLFPDGIRNRTYRMGGESNARETEIKSTVPSFWELAQTEAATLRAEREKHEAETRIRTERKRNLKLTVVHEVSVHTNRYSEENEVITVNEFITSRQLNEEDSNKLRSSLQDGHFVDTSGYRGQGLWYNDNGTLHKTIGEYGYFVPSVSWKKVLERGLSYFEDTGALFVMIPDGSKIIEKERTIIAKNHAFTIEPEDENSDETYSIEGKFFNNTSLYELY